MYWTTKLVYIIKIMKKELFNILLFLGCTIPTCLFILLMGWLLLNTQHDFGIRKDISIILYWIITAPVIYYIGKLYEKKKR